MEIYRDTINRKREDYVHVKGECQRTARQQIKHYGKRENKVNKKNVLS